jgi:hypothetical protein
MSSPEFEFEDERLRGFDEMLARYSSSRKPPSAEELASERHRVAMSFLEEIETRKPGQSESDHTKEIAGHVATLVQHFQEAAVAANRDKRRMELLTAAGVAFGLVGAIAAVVAIFA